MRNSLTISGINWTHLSAPTRWEISQISKKHDLHELIEEDILELNTQDKIDVYDDYIFMVFHFPKYNESEKRYMLNEFDIILWKNYIVSITRFHTNHIDKIKNEYSKEINEDENPEKFKISPYYILYKVLDVMFDKALNLLTKITKDIIYLEEEMFSKGGLNKELLESLMIKRRNIVFLKHTFLPQSELLEELQKIIPNFYQGELDLYFEDLVYKLDKIQNQLSILSENINSLTETYNSLMNIRISSIINILTVFTAITWILTFISWIYWMNIPLPMQDKPYSFLVVVLVMLVCVWTMLYVFRRKWWI